LYKNRHLIYTYKHLLLQGLCAQHVDLQPVSEALAKLTLVRMYTLVELQQRPLPETVDAQRLEVYLNDEDFQVSTSLFPFPSLSLARSGDCIETKARTQRTAVTLYTVSPKNIPDIFDCNLKTNYQILIIFGTNIPETTCQISSFFFIKTDKFAIVFDVNKVLCL